MKSSLSVCCLFAVCLCLVSSHFCLLTWSLILLCIFSYCVFTFLFVDDCLLILLCISSYFLRSCALSLFVCVQISFVFQSKTRTIERIQSSDGSQGHYDSTWCRLEIIGRFQQSPVRRRGQKGQSAIRNRFSQPQSHQNKFFFCLFQ